MLQLLKLQLEYVLCLKTRIPIRYLPVAAPFSPIQDLTMSLKNDQVSTTEDQEFQEGQEELPPFSPSQIAQKLNVDFSWRKFNTLITDATTGTPLFKVKYSLNKPQIKFISAVDDTILGNGTVNEISINAECELHGREVKLKALNRFKSRYGYLSRGFAADPVYPTEMTWTGRWGMKLLDLVCVNDKQEAVAKLSCNLWGMKRIATIEFADGVAFTQAAKDEIVVTGLTIMYVLAARSGSLGNLFGALFARPGPIKKKDQASLGTHGDGGGRA